MTDYSPKVDAALEHLVHELGFLNTPKGEQDPDTELLVLALLDQLDYHGDTIDGVCDVLGIDRLFDRGRKGSGGGVGWGESKREA